MCLFVFVLYEIIKLSIDAILRFVTSFTDLKKKERKLW